MNGSRIRQDMGGFYVVSACASLCCRSSFISDVDRNNSSELDHARVRTIRSSMMCRTGPRTGPRLERRTPTSASLHWHPHWPSLPCPFSHCSQTGNKLQSEYHIHFRLIAISQGLRQRALVSEDVIPSRMARGENPFPFRQRLIARSRLDGPPVVAFRPVIAQIHYIS